MIHRIEPSVANVMKRQKGISRDSRGVREGGADERDNRETTNTGAP